MTKSFLRPLGWIVFTAALPVFSVSPFSRDPLVVICAGDSLMRPIPAHIRALAPAEGLDLDIREWAHGGLNSKTYLSFFDRNRPRWAGTHGDAILLQLGTNDALPLLEGKRSAEEFRAGIAAVLDELVKFRKPGDRRPALFLATVPLFCDRPESAGINRIVESVINPALREIAASEGAVLVEQYLVLKNRPELYDPDCVHPNADGEAALARNWLKALREFFSKDIV
jgi:lysophospholipase L1-like esterase